MSLDYLESRLWVVKSRAKNHWKTCSSRTEYTFCRTCDQDAEEALSLEVLIDRALVEGAA